MKNLLTILFLLVLLPTFSRGSTMDEKLFESLHGHASFNVVMAVIAIILCGLFITLWRIDRKVSRLEKEIQDKKS